MKAIDGTLAVLVVCEANICRSPAAAFALSERLPDALVASAGWSARSGSPLCDRVAAALHARGDRRSEIDDFRSRAVQALDLEEFDLVLTATRAIRGGLARTQPWVRDRLFTLVEATTLFAAEGDGAPPWTRATGIAEYLNLRRGMVVSSRPRFRGRSRQDREFDIIDGHGSRTRPHQSAISESLERGDQIGRALAWGRQP
ncbi:low molecular weight phosphatase family protein [Marisediminicola sp. LYQ85]|uniref:arsenate-mycothiol transferase ArsC n=1 Tax=Marisediminicola sp. LYQ85 TaxID=3391062 RepID=UPI003983348E